uniref:Coronin n=1 Tax=Neogobius melanostomus TaxID=47308 RepID=A0A8C6WNT1_9GOBI
WISNVRGGSISCQGNHIKTSSKLVVFSTEQVKLWRLRDPESAQPSEAELTLHPGHGKLELVLFHPTSSGLLAVGATNSPLVWDTSRQDAPLAVLEQHSDQLQSLSWKPDGSLLASSCKVSSSNKPKTVNIFISLLSKTISKTRIRSTAQNSKDSRILWAKDDLLLTTGFDMMRGREVRLWDSRKLSSSVSSASLGTANGTVIPLFDDDTGLLILAGMVGLIFIPVFLFVKLFMNIDDWVADLSHCLTDAPTRGVCAVPKLDLDVMSCEVVRVLQLTDSHIVPISYQVPRKVCHEFHADLYPDTVGATPAMSAGEWWQGGNKQVPMEKVSLNPDKRPKTRVPRPYRVCLVHTDSFFFVCFVFHVLPNGDTVGTVICPGPSTKFRHIQGTVMHRDTHITNIRGLNLTTPGECDGFCANSKHVAVPLATSGGQIGVFERSKPGRQPDTNVPTFQNSVNVADLCWDPFDPHRLAVAGDDAKIRLWQVPEGGLVETLTEPDLILQGHTEKIYSIKFHPLASGLLVSSSYDLTVRLWNLDSGDQVKLLTGHEDQVFAMAWSPDGKLLATVCKDGKVRIYEPRKSATPVQEGPGPGGHRGARIVWVCEGKYLLVSGFNVQSERGLYLFSADSLSSGAVGNINVDVSPSILIPFYDPDTSVVILTGKGDTRVHIYEIVPESPYFVECSSFNTPEPHKGLAFLAKTECNVQDVEIAVALMLTKTTVEPVSFKVPRVKKEFFQDDVYPDTTICWEPALTAAAWLSGSNGEHKKMSLKPKDMIPVSEAPKEVPVKKYMPSSYYLEEKTDEQKKDELLSAMVAKLGNLDDPLPQEAFEGVDEDEWVCRQLEC